MESAAEASPPGTTSGVESAGVELTGILALGSPFAPLSQELLGSDSGAVAQSLGPTIAEVTGVDLFMSVEQGLAMAPVGGLTGAEERTATGVAEAASAADAGGVLAPAHVLSDASETSNLTDTGDISSGDVITFPEATLGLVDELFAGPKYTDYNVTLQTHKSEVVEHQAESSSAPVPLDIVETVVAIPEPTPAASDPAPDNLLHASISVLHLAL